MYNINTWRKIHHPVYFIDIFAGDMALCLSEHSSSFHRSLSKHRSDYTLIEKIFKTYINRGFLYIYHNYQYPTDEQFFEKYCHITRLYVKTFWIHTLRISIKEWRNFLRYLEMNRFDDFTNVYSYSSVRDGFIGRKEIGPDYFPMLYSCSSKNLNTLEHKV